MKVEAWKLIGWCGGPPSCSVLLLATWSLALGSPLPSVSLTSWGEPGAGEGDQGLGKEQASSVLSLPSSFGSDSLPWLGTCSRRRGSSVNAGGGSGAGNRCAPFLGDQRGSMGLFGITG